LLGTPPPPEVERRVSGEGAEPSEVLALEPEEGNAQVARFLRRHRLGRFAQRIRDAEVSSLWALARLTPEDLRSELRLPLGPRKLATNAFRALKEDLSEGRWPLSSARGGASAGTGGGSARSPSMSSVARSEGA